MTACQIIAGIYGALLVIVPLVAIAALAHRQARASQVDDTDEAGA